MQSCRDNGDSIVCLLISLVLKVSTCSNDFWSICKSLHNFSSQSLLLTWQAPASDSSNEMFPKVSTPAVTFQIPSLSSTLKPVISRSRMISERACLLPSFSEGITPGNMFQEEGVVRTKEGGGGRRKKLKRFFLFILPLFKYSKSLTLSFVNPSSALRELFAPPKRK